LQPDITGMTVDRGENGGILMDETTNTLQITQAAFNEMIKLANSGDASAVAQLCELLDGHPWLWQRVGRLAIECQLLLIQQASRGDQLIEQSVTRMLAHMRTNLGESEPTPLEQIVVEQVVTCWLQVQVADKAVASDKGGTLPNAHFLLKRQDLAHRHLAAAIKSLNEIRKLLPKQRIETRETDQPPNLLVFPTDDVPDALTPALSPTGTC
jgi:hypothetical protein